jgi:hypothetical protein
MTAFWVLTAANSGHRPISSRSLMSQPTAGYDVRWGSEEKGGGKRTVEKVLHSYFVAPHHGTCEHGSTRHRYVRGFTDSAWACSQMSTERRKEGKTLINFLVYLTSNFHESSFKREYSILTICLVREIITHFRAPGYLEMRKTAKVLNAEHVSTAFHKRLEHMLASQGADVVVVHVQQFPQDRVRVLAECGRRQVAGRRVARHVDRAVQQWNRRRRS